VAVVDAAGVLTVQDLEAKVGGKQSEPHDPVTLRSIINFSQI